MIYTLGDQQTNARSAYAIEVEWCDPFSICIEDCPLLPFRQEQFLNTQSQGECCSMWLIGEICTTVWVEMGDGSGGDSGGESGGSGGGSGGSSGGDGGWTPTGCDDGVYPARSSQTYYYPCAPGWEPAPPDDGLDQTYDQWMANNIKDSTNNQCVGSTLSTLKSIDSKLPKLINNFFGNAPSFNMTLKMENINTSSCTGCNPEGGHTNTNISDNNFKVFINGYYTDATNLSVAATIIHEAFHCQLMDWFRQAQIDNDTALQNQLARDYGYIFTTQLTNIDSSLAAIVNGGNATQHQDMVNRYKSLISEALYEFAQAKGISVTHAYCDDLAWAGTFDSNAFHALSSSDQTRIIEIVNAEKDPNGNTINLNNDPYKGHPCL